MSLLFLFTGEGAHACDSDISSLKSSPSWADVDAAIDSLYQTSTEAFLRVHLGDHSAPYSPVVTTCINILNADRWRQMGHEPAAVLGHSIGEVAAAYVAGLLDIKAALRTAHALGMVGAQRSGAMLHTW
eukprot:2605191-Prymnesium_polylepis.2